MASHEIRQDVGRAGGASQRPDSPDPFDDKLSPVQHLQHHEQMEVIEISDDDVQDSVEEPDRGLQRGSNSQRNQALEHTHQSSRAFMADGVEYKVGQLIELTEPIGLFVIQFLEIKSIHENNETGEIIIRGLPYSRTRNLDKCLPCKLNEVCVVLEVDDDDERSIEDQALVEIEAEDVKKARVLHNTNKSFPACRFDPVGFASDERREEAAPLACRWTMVRHYKDSRQRRSGRCYGLALVHKTEQDHATIKKRNLGEDKDRAQQWRGETISGGSAFQGGADGSQPVHQYSFADFNCGAGGASRGAEMADLKIVAAVEPWMHACDTYRTNFPDARLYEMDTQNFLEEIQHSPVDILNLSPPFKSHTAEDNEDNAETKNNCVKLITKLLPRLFIMVLPITMLSERQSTLLNNLIQGFTSVGYSVQWRSTSFVEYGLPQMRKRLIMIGAGPGETLPQWPPVSHSADLVGSQQPFVTEAEAINGLTPETTTLHDPQTLRSLNRRARAGDEPLGTLSASAGAAVIHFSGSRDFTLRELACLQGFPQDHQFEGSGIKKQIGTAFPPSVAKVFFHHMRRSLEEHDGVPQGSPARQATPVLQPAVGVVINNHRHEEDNQAEDQDEVMADAIQSIELDTDHNALNSPGTAAGDGVDRDVDEDEDRKSRINATPGSRPRSRFRIIIQPRSPVARRSYVHRGIAAFTPRLSRTPGAEAETNIDPFLHGAPPSPESPPNSVTTNEFVGGSRAAALRRKRARGLDEEVADHDDDGGSPDASQQRPSKRHRQHANVSENHEVKFYTGPRRTALSSSRNVAHSVREPSMQQSPSGQQGGWASHRRVEDLAPSFSEDDHMEE
ncbi:hypothetical protein Daus18300_012800 [Diaporthe australafricana]|uniref:DNA (cytosine-5-)-methyltransferase n=1 Tax=Diaporthe australafricana TaxID=127596 RepID=A0ABR3W1C1_9PEZI